MDLEGRMRVLAESFPTLSIRAARIPPEGYDYFVLVVNDDLLFRLPRRPAVDAQLRREVRLLAGLADALPLAVPRYIFVGEGCASFPHPVGGYHLLPGEPLRSPLVAALPEAETVAHALGGFLQALHAYPLEHAIAAAFAPASPDGWWAEYAHLYERVRSEVFPLLDATQRARLAHLWEPMLAERPGFTVRLVHRDFNSDHLLWDAGARALTGILDWGDAALGDPAIDFAALLDEYGDQFVWAALATYGGSVDSGFWRRAAWYGHIAPVYEVLFGVSTGSQQHIARGIARVRQMVASDGAE